MNVNKIIYWIATGLLSAMMLMSAGMYFFNNVEVSATFERLGYPAALVYPLAIAKLLGITAILTKKSALLKNLAYVGFLINFTLALIAHLKVNDGEFYGAAMALVLLAASYFFDRKVFTPSIT
ncbi:DoxX family protein [Flammeovirgaceae bacterium SG7u.111]|nr:DoxX family protein [Flammeovirgaceae bacterium SG7u.132]WPO33037.1 DoxX family protein [Flammeovirgaceae bacterium SG7u.111]